MVEEVWEGWDFGKEGVLGYCGTGGYEGDKVGDIYGFDGNEVEDIKMIYFSNKHNAYDSFSLKVQSEFLSTYDYDSLSRETAANFFLLIICSY